MACACQVFDKEKLRIAILKHSSVLLARPLAGAAPELLPGLFYKRLRGLELPERDDMLPDSIRERLESTVRQASTDASRSARRPKRATQVRHHACASHCCYCKLLQRSRTCLAWKTLLPSCPLLGVGTCFIAADPEL